MKWKGIRTGLFAAVVADSCFFYEPPEEEQRMGQVRVRMANEAGANAIVVCCPFCLTHLEDGVKTTGFEGKIQVMDLTELIVKQLIIE